MIHIATDVGRWNIYHIAHYSAGNDNELVKIGFSENAVKRSQIQSKVNLGTSTNWIIIFLWVIFKIEISL